MSPICLDEIKHSRIQGEYHHIDTPSFQPMRRQIEKGSTIEKTVNKVDSCPLHRPKLSPPQQHFMIDLLDLHAKLERLVSKELTIFKSQSKEDLATIERLEKEREEALRRNAEEAAKRNNWNVLGTLSQYLGSGSAIAVGMSLSSPLGALLVTSGVLGLGDRVIRDTIGWEKVAGWFTSSVENQKRLAQKIEMGFLYVELGTGLSGGLGAAYTGAFSAMAANMDRLAAAKKASVTIQTTGAWMKTTSQLGKSFQEKRMSDLQAKMKQLDAYAERIRMEMASQVTETRNMIDAAHLMGQEMHKSIIASEIHDL